MPIVSKLDWEAEAYCKANIVKANPVRPMGKGKNMSFVSSNRAVFFNGSLKQPPM